MARYLQHIGFVQVFTKIATVVIPLLLCSQLQAQTDRNDVFSPIGKYIVKGDADCLSAWFDDNLEISVTSRESNASRAQARQILKTFFDAYTPQSFNITHTAERPSMKYALGNLNAGGETFSVTIFVSVKDDGYKIQQLKIERL